MSITFLRNLKKFKEWMEPENSTSSKLKVFRGTFHALDAGLDGLVLIATVWSSAATSISISAFRSLSSPANSVPRSFWSTLLYFAVCEFSRLVSLTLKTVNWFNNLSIFLPLSLDCLLRFVIASGVYQLNVIKLLKLKY